MDVFNALDFGKAGLSIGDALTLVLEYYPDLDECGKRCDQSGGEDKEVRVDQKGISPASHHERGCGSYRKDIVSQPVNELSIH